MQMHSGVCTIMNRVTVTSFCLQELPCTAMLKIYYVTALYKAVYNYRPISS